MVCIPCCSSSWGHRGCDVCQVKRSRNKGGFAGPDGCRSVFGQICAKMSLFGPDSLMLPHRVWKVKFIGQYSAKQRTFSLEPL